MSDTESTRRYTNEKEQLILLASTMLCLQLSQGKTTNEIELLALILQNVATQLATIADIRLLNDGNEDFLQVVPII